MVHFRPARIFLVTFLPGAAGAAALGNSALVAAPALGPAVMLTLGFLAYALGVTFATASSGARGKGALLLAFDLRRRRGRLAGLFAGIATGVWVACDWGSALLGLDRAIPLGPGHLALAFALLFVAAWFIIGETAGSQVAIRRALLSARDRRV